MVQAMSHIWLHYFYCTPQTLPLLVSFNPLGSWVLNSRATNHIYGNNSMFSSLSTPCFLPSVTITSGSQASSHGIRVVHLLPTLSIDNIL